MRKIPSLFVRDFSVRWPDGGHRVRDEVNPECAWVAAGEGRATRKWDGQAVLVKDGLVFVRHDAKRGRTPPAEFVPAQPAPDPVSGHWPGWVPATGPAARYVLEAIEWARETLFDDRPVPDGTYEAVGPSIATRHGVNPERLERHVLVAHGADAVDAPRDFGGLLEWLRGLPIEGVVWHHPDGRMAKIKKADFPYPLAGGTVLGVSPTRPAGDRPAAVVNGPVGGGMTTAAVRQHVVSVPTGGGKTAEAARMLARMMAGEGGEGGR